MDRSMTLLIMFVVAISACAPVAPQSSESDMTVMPFPENTFSPINTPQPTHTRDSYVSTPIPTATEIQLPFIDGVPVGREYCKRPKVALLIADAEGLSEDEIAAKLMGLHLDYFNNSKAPGYCRVDGYQIEKVFQLEPGKVEPFSPKGDFLRVVWFSVKLIQLPNWWMSYPGEIDQQNWLHTGEVLAITKVEVDGVYTMQFSSP